MKNSIPPLEQDMILAHILKKSREYVLTHPEIRLTRAQKARFEKLLKRRQNHEPMVYILGRKEFYGLDFKVNKHTLIPRPETEILVEETLKCIQASKHQNKLSVIDIGTGSGNIIISVAHTCSKYGVSGIKYFGVDISSEALSIAKSNARNNIIDKKIKFLKGDILKPSIKNSKFKIQNSIIVANLPYLSKKIYASTMPDVKNFEPKSALLSGKDGLDHYEKLLSQIKSLKAKSYMPKAILEISPEQKPKISKLIKKYFPFSEVEFKKDLAGKWRVAKISI